MGKPRWKTKPRVVVSSDRAASSLVQRDRNCVRVAANDRENAQKKAAWLPRRPFLSYGGATLAGDFRTCKPGAYLPAVSYSGAAADRVSRDLLPEPTRWSPISAR
jgi:hypothetical protein